MAAFNIMVQWDGLKPDENGVVRLSIKHSHSNLQLAPLVTNLGTDSPSKRELDPDVRMV